ncbi:MAG: hypothetical protein EOO39_23345 [Cytophagaceae bacterium]|nr:MAG: hypothetical protein EOO39_23345 [Cytophagaceae bacterium]
MPINASPWEMPTCRTSQAKCSF